MIPSPTHTHTHQEKVSETTVLWVMYVVDFPCDFSQYLANSLHDHKRDLVALVQNMNLRMRASNICQCEGQASGLL